MKQSSLLAAGALGVAVLFISPAILAQRDAGRPLPQDIGAEPGHLPKVHYVPSDPWRPFPIWIDASMVLTKDGTINPLIERPEGEEHLKALLAAPIDHGCAVQDMLLDDLYNPPDRRNIEEATKNSRLVILGKVTEKAFGVDVYVAGQLLRVVPQEILKGEPRSVPAYFAFMPVGNFKIGNVPVCAKDGRFPDAPNVGDQVLLFVPDGTSREAQNSEPLVDLLDDGGIVTIHSDSTVSLPQRFGKIGAPKSPGLTPAEDVLARARNAAKQQDH